MTKAFLLMSLRTRVIGIDFDNTIACYDELLFRLALERRLIPSDFRAGKKAIRDHIRTLPDGEKEWQRLQAILYGPAIDGAQLYAGVMDFISRCRSVGICIHIVSHKTAYSNLLGGGVNFREAATRWMQNQGFFDPARAGLGVDQIHYESTREDKVSRIRWLGCTDFIDDLEETFLEDSFPKDVNKVLFNPHAEPVQARDVRNCSHWSQIQDLIFHECSGCN
jgi:hypothetical protein